MPQAKQRVVETTTDYKNSGALTVAFANGDEQSLPLVAEMQHPRLEVKPKKLDYGRVHVQSPKTLQVVLSNPTYVDAAWAVTVEGHRPKFPVMPGTIGAGEAVPMPPPSNSAPTAAAAAAAATASGARGLPPALKPPVVAGVPPGVTGLVTEARIGPYIVRPASGVLPGRGLRLPHQQAISITFAPTEAETYEGELIFAVMRGKECSVEIDGKGSIEETDEHKGKLYVI